MKQNTVWLIIGLFIVIFVQGFFVMQSDNKAPGALLMVSSVIGLLVSILGSHK